MGAWGIGLYSGDFATDLKATISAVCRLPLDEEPLVEAICQSEAYQRTSSPLAGNERDVRAPLGPEPVGPPETGVEEPAPGRAARE